MRKQQNAPLRQPITSETAMRLRMRGLSPHSCNMKRFGGRCARSSGGGAGAHAIGRLSRRSLRALVKAGAFGMTPYKIGAFHTNRATADFRARWKLNLANTSAIQRCIRARGTRCSEHVVLHAVGAEASAGG